MTRPLLIDTSAWVEAMRRRGDEITRNEVYAALRTGRARFCDDGLDILHRDMHFDRLASLIPPAE